MLIIKLLLCPKNEKELNIRMFINLGVFLIAYILGMIWNNGVVILIMFLLIVMNFLYFIYLTFYPLVSDYYFNKNNFKSSNNPKGYIFSRYYNFGGKGNDETINEVTRTLNHFYWKNKSNSKQVKYSEVTLQRFLDTKKWKIKLSCDLLNDCITDLEKGLSLYKDIVQFRNTVFNMLLSSIPIIISSGLIIYKYFSNYKLLIGLISIALIFVKAVTYGNSYATAYENYKNLHNYLTTFKIVLKNKR